MPETLFEFDPDFISSGDKAKYRLISRLLLMVHPLINRDKALKNLEKALMAKTIKTAQKFKTELYPSPLLSVIVPCYNYGHYLNEALESLYEQTFQNFEIIIVNDGSTEEATLKILERLEKKPKLKILHQQNQGLSATRNNGIKTARGKYICCLDADDKLEPTYFEKALALLESSPETAFVTPWVQYFDASDANWITGSLKNSTCTK